MTMRLTIGLKLRVVSRMHLQIVTERFHSRRYLKSLDSSRLYRCIALEKANHGKIPSQAQGYPVVAFHVVIREQGERHSAGAAEP